MQSKLMSAVEAVTYTIASATAAALANYFILPVFWGLHPTTGDSVSMAVFFGLLSLATKYPIRRLFNAIK